MNVSLSILPGTSHASQWLLKAFTFYYIIAYEPELQSDAPVSVPEHSRSLPVQAKPDSASQQHGAPLAPHSVQVRSLRAGSSLHPRPGLQTECRSSGMSAGPRQHSWSVSPHSSHLAESANETAQTGCLSLWERNHAARCVPRLHVSPDPHWVACSPVLQQYCPFPPHAPSMVATPESSASTQR